MYTNHAKAIKGMSIANIVLAALGILCAIAAIAAIGMGGSAIDMSGYDYFYTDDGYYIEADTVTGLLGMAGVVMCCMFICCVLVLVAGIMGVRGADKPEKLKGIMVWNIVGAVAGFCGAGWISLVLCIIVAVFAHKDKSLYAPAVPAYGAAYGAAPAAPVAPQQPYGAQVPEATPVSPAVAAPGYPAQPVSDPAPVVPTEPVAATAVTEATVIEAAPAEPAVVEETVAAAEPAVILPDNHIEDAIAGVTIIEEPSDDKPEA